MPGESERTLTEDEIATADYMINHGIDSPSEMSSEELKSWIRALEPCEACQLRTPFRCRRCKAVVCLHPQCRKDHDEQCPITWRQWIVKSCGYVKEWVQEACGSIC